MGLMQYKITSVSQNGFYRCGRFWPQGGAVVNEGDFTAGQWAILRAEPQLKITPEPKAKPATKEV